MVGIILISHGKLAGAMKATAEMILGSLEDFEAVEFIEGMTPETLQEITSQAIKKINSSDGILLFADLFGGTPARVIGELVLTHRYPAIAGVNLPMLLEICPMRSYSSIEEIKATALESGRQAIIDINNVLGEA
jgi:PTS system mannose-specific IIA component